MASNVLPLFWHLASSSRDTRLTASADLVAAAQNFQSTYTPPVKTGDEDEDEDDEEDDGDESGMEVDGDDDDEEGEGMPVDPVVAAKLDAKLARENAPDVVYCIKRLIRGLGSSREHSRLGFAVALTELLARSPNVTAAQILSLLIRSSHWSKGMKGSDERDMMFARMFGVTSIVDSGLLFSSTSTQDDFMSVIDSLIALADSKAWMVEAAGWGLLRAAEGLLASSVEWKDDALAALTERVYANRVWSPEKIALTLALQRGAPSLDWKALLSPTFKTSPLLAQANLVTLGRVLKEGGDDDSSARAGTYQPKLHYVWDGIFAEYFTHSAEGIAPFAELWRTVVDEALFANTSSAERKYWGFQVFERALPLLPSENAPLIFTPNFMRSWMNNLSSADRHLHKAALQAARKVNEHVKADPTAGFTLLSQLVGKHGRPDFDRVTKTKTVEGIMASLTLDGVDKYVAYLESVLVGEDGGDERRTWALEQMLALCRNGAVPRGDAWVGRVLDTLMVHGFFLVRKADKRSAIVALRTVPKPPLSDVVAATARARFLASIVEVTAHKDKDDKHGVDAKGKLWLSRALDTLAALEKNKNVEVVTDADDEIKAIRTNALAVLAGLKGRDEAAARGTEILISFLVLQTYDEAEDALDMLDEAVTAVKGLFPEKKRGRKPKKAAEEEDGDAPPPIDALLDVLIALLDKSSADLRTLANLVFGMLVPAMTSSAVEHLVAQLESSGATEDAEVDSDEEHEHGPDCDHSHDEEDDEDDDEDGSDADSVASDETDADASVDPEFRRRVAEALKVSGVLAEDKEGDDEDDSDNESVWDDDQMMKVDEQLAAVFKTARGDKDKKSDLKHAATETLHFKNRVLDFFDVFLRRPSALALNLLLPLLHVVRGGGELGNKAAGILRTRLKSASASNLASSTDASELEAATKVISEIHGLARKAPTAEFSTLCSAASVFAARLAPDAALQAYKDTLGDFVTRKHSSVHPAFVAEYVKRNPSRAWALGGEILDLLEGGKAANAYRHTQAYSLLGALLTQAPALVKGEVKAKDVEDVVKRSMADVYGVLERAASDQGAEWKADRLKDVGKFALVAARAAKSLGGDAKKLCDSERLTSVSEAVKSGRTKEMKGVHALLSQLSAVLNKEEGGKKAKKGKKEEVKVEVNGDKEETPSKPSKKRKAEDVVAEAKPKKEGKVAKEGKTVKAVKAKSKKARAE